MFARATLLWAAVASLQFISCSSSNLQDMNKGTDVGVGFVPPDVGPLPDTAPDTQDVASDQVEANDVESIEMDAGTDGTIDTPVNRDD